MAVVTGPPGTGKTRVIAALVEILTSHTVAKKKKGRVLIVAPANSASRRVLESIVNTQFEEACLIVSQEYFYEWHEGAYGQSLSNYVHTKTRLRDQDRQQAAPQHQRTSVDMADPARRAGVDFRERASVAHHGKWTEKASQGGECPQSAPRVLIGTYGCIANAVAENKARGWRQQVENLLERESISAVIIDETSQLWSGFALGLLTRLPKATRIVFVGDDQQLAPYGVTDIPGLVSLSFLSLFAAARCRTSS